MTNTEFTKTPNFVRRLYREASDPTNKYICWSDDGEKIRIVDKEGFIKNTLQKLSKTKEFSGFVRQLNIYGFVKTKGDKNDEAEEYYNCFFKKDQPSLITFVKRESKNKRTDIKLDQHTIENSINYLNNANYKLSNEVAELKTRVEKQDRTINGLLDIFSRVFRSGVQNFNYESSPLETQPDIFSKYKNEIPKIVQKDKILSITENKENSKKKKSDQSSFDMADVFF